LTLSSFVEAIFLVSWERDGRPAKDSNPLKRRLQFDRHMLITGSGLDQMAASAESDSRSPHAVSGGAAEQILARDNGRLAIKIEGRLPIGMAREYGRVLGGDRRAPAAACCRRERETRYGRECGRAPPGR
jgi:hypothetical protein